MFLFNHLRSNIQKQATEMPPGTSSPTTRGPLRSDAAPHSPSACVHGMPMTRHRPCSARVGSPADQRTALSDDEMSDLGPARARSWSGSDEGAFVSGDEAPARSNGRAKQRAADDDDEEAGEGAEKEDEGDEDDEDDEDEEGDEGEDLGEDEFIVEAVKKHMIDDDGSLKFLVKWEGWEKKSDMTWEPEDNLVESASEVLDNYFDSIGGRDTIFEETETASRRKKRGRMSSGTAAAAATTKRARKDGRHPADSTPPATTAKWSPPAGSWEDEIESIDACEDEGSGKLIVYLIWKNGRKTRHDTACIYKKCPQKMLQFYERHVRIVKDGSEKQRPKSAAAARAVDWEGSMSRPADSILALGCHLPRAQMRLSGREKGRSIRFVRHA
ncbi:hypothetical protein RJ55_00887 [Drechmeria coniospora]|nr:hypothetical protein RJ55_00887 [Drechmeria coniospora]